MKSIYKERKDFFCKEQKMLELKRIRKNKYEEIELSIRKRNLTTASTGHCYCHETCFLASLGKFRAN